MINDDFDFTLDSSDFPVSIEEFAAYLDGNLSDKEMERISSVVENDEVMQDVMDEMELSELTLAEYGQEDLQLPEEIKSDFFSIPDMNTNDLEYHILGGFHKAAAFAPSFEDDFPENKNIARTPPQVLRDLDPTDNETDNSQDIEYGQ